MKEIFKKSLGFVILNLMCASGVYFAASFLPLLTGKLVDQVSGGSFQHLKWIILGYILSIMGLLVFEYFNKVTSILMSKRWMVELKRRVFNAIIHKNYEDYYSKEIGNYVSITHNNSESVVEEYFETWASLASTLISLIIYIGVLMSVSVQLAICVTLFSVLPLLIPNVFEQNLTIKRRHFTHEQEHYIGTLKDLFSGFLHIQQKTYPTFCVQHETQVNQLESKRAVYLIYNSLCQVMSGVMLYLTQILTFVVGIYFLWRGEITVGVFVAALSYIDLIMLPLRDIVYQFINLKSIRPVVKELEQLLEEVKPSILPEVNTFNTLKFQKVEYDIKPFHLEIEDLTFEAGKKYVIIGPSGSGKSTITKLIMKHIVPTKGQISVDDVTVENLELSSLIASISQFDHIFSTNVLNNITLFGSLHHEKDQQFIQELGLQELIERDVSGENGNLLSGGEKNRISIARALMQNKKILILDEVFASLDKQSARLITNFINQHPDLTVISISHDITAENLNLYDVVIQLEQGRIKDIS